MKTNLRNGIPLKTLRPHEFTNRSTKAKQWSDDWDIGEDVYLDERTTIKLKSVEELTTSPGAAYCEFACHNCRQRTRKVKVSCSRCPNTFCGECLLSLHGEKIWNETEEGVKWVCPKCRGGCGPGCSNCCTCGSCRKSGGLAPTGQILRIAREAGFDNVHDYLVHFQTGDSSSQIARRKDGRGWTKAGSLSVRESGNEPRVRPEGCTSGAARKLPEVSGKPCASWTHETVERARVVGLKRGFQREVEISQKRVLDHILGRSAPNATGRIDGTTLSNPKDPRFCNVSKEGSVRRNTTRVAPWRFRGQEDDSTNEIGKDRQASENTIHHCQQALQANEKDGKQPSREPTQLIKPVTSLQALRKMGILAKRAPPVDQLSEGPVQSKRPASMASASSEDLEQSLTKGSEVENSSNLRLSESLGLQEKSTALLETREKSVQGGAGNLAVRDGLEGFGNKGSLSSFDRFGSNAGFGQRTTLQSGFELFHGPKTSTGFEAFRSAGRAGLDLLAFRK